MIVFIVVVSVYSIVVSYIAVVQIMKVSRLTGIVEITLENLNNLHRLVTEASGKFEDEKLKTAFSGDDEVGFFFKELEDIQNSIQLFMQSMTDEKTS